MSVAKDKWTVGLCEIGECGNCCLSFICPSIAASLARSRMDQSSCCFNFCAMNPMVTRHLIRSAYGIPGSECEDCYMTMFCPCCTINQMIQTTTAYGLPTQDGGRMRNVNQFTTEAGNCTCGTCMYSLFCCPCAIGSTMEKAIGMNFWFGCCCVNMCTARNVVRYQYRLAGDDCCDDFCAPTCGAILTYYCPCFILCTFPYFLATIMKIISEAENRTQAAGVYGSKYLPPLATAPPPVVMGVEQTHNVVVVPTVIINNPNQA